jgi:hypothetical protein
MGIYMAQEIGSRPFAPLVAAEPQRTTEVRAVISELDLAVVEIYRALETLHERIALVMRGNPAEMPPSERDVSGPATVRQAWSVPLAVQIGEIVDRIRALTAYARRMAEAVEL